jgi:hypothetical protein
MISYRTLLVLIIAAYRLQNAGTLAQLSNPIASNKQIDARTNKYLQRHPDEDDHFNPT